MERRHGDVGEKIKIAMLHADAQEVSASTLPVAAAASLWEHLHVILVHVPVPTCKAGGVTGHLVFCSASHGMGWDGIGNCRYLAVQYSYLVGSK